jgi:hypothetical protein
MIGEIVICPSFMSILQDIRYVIRNFVSFVGDGYGILFEIFLHTDDVVADIQPFSAYPDESEIPIVTSTVFCVDKVCEY